MVLQIYIFLLPAQIADRNRCDSISPAHGEEYYDEFPVKATTIYGVSSRNCNGYSHLPDAVF